MHDQTGRPFLCARCQAQVLVRIQCDRGQRYCANGCANISRRSLQREAGERYQQSRAGRHKHAARKRCAALAKIVMYHGSQVPLTDTVLTANESPPAISPDSQPQSPCSSIASESIALSATANTQISMTAPLWRCHWCQSPCPSQVRQGFLRHSRWVGNGCHP